MDILCSHCNHGTVKLEAISDFPDNLCSLFENNHQKSKAFFERIRNIRLHLLMPM